MVTIAVDMVMAMLTMGIINNKQLVTLKGKTIQGLLWTGLELVGTKGTAFLFNILLARILSPNDYGLIAIALVFTTIAQTITDSGFANALIRKTDMAVEDLSTAFCFNVVMSLPCYALLFFTAPYVAHFFSEPTLVSLIRVLSIGVIVGAFSTVQQTIFTREINFKQLTQITIVATLFSGVVGVVFALNGFGVWSLMIQNLTQQVVRTVLLYLKCSWKPSFGWSNGSFRHLWSFGSKLLVSSLLFTLFNNISGLLIGKFYTASVLGNFVTARKMSEVPSSTLTGMIQRVTYPVLSTMQGDDDRLKSNYAKILQYATFVIFPLMMTLSASADPLVKVIYGEKWVESIFLLQVICFSMMLYPIHALNLNLLQVKGRSDLFLLLEVIKTIGGIVILWIALPRGVEWIVGLEVVGSFLALFANTFFSGRLVGLGFLQQLRFLFPILLISGLVWIAIVWVNQQVDNLYMQLILDGIVALVVYLSLSALFLRGLMQEMIAIVKERLQ